MNTVTKEPSSISSLSRNIGGSVLPSSNPQILQPIECSFGKLQVRELPLADTHGLFLITDRGETNIALHPNGYSCHSLAKRMKSLDIERVREQAEYIVCCGGKTMPIDQIIEIVEKGRSPILNVVKTYNLMFNIGHAKYVVNFHDGKKCHKDGSPFFDMETFKNKQKRDSFIRDLEAQGYSEGQLSIYRDKALV